MTRRRRTPWQRIFRAADAGTGLRLSAEDVLRLSRDGAIQSVAEGDDLHWSECPKHDGFTDEVSCPWCSPEVGER